MSPYRCRSAISRDENRARPSGLFSSSAVAQPLPEQGRAADGATVSSDCFETFGIRNPQHPWARVPRRRSRWHRGPLRSFTRPIRVAHSSTARAYSRRRDRVG